MKNKLKNAEHQHIRFFERRGGIASFSPFSSILLSPLLPYPLPRKGISDPSRESEEHSQQGPSRAPAAKAFLVYLEPRKRLSGCKCRSISAKRNLKIELQFSSVQFSDF